MDRIYYIENIVNEYNTRISGYFPTLDVAKEALKECSDWFLPNGTGEIYSIGFGLDAKPVLEFRSR
jgi:hypothetical protein